MWFANRLHLIVNILHVNLWCNCDRWCNHVLILYWWVIHFLFLNQNLTKAQNKHKTILHNKHAVTFKWLSFKSLPLLIKLLHYTIVKHTWLCIADPMWFEQNGFYHMLLKKKTVPKFENSSPKGQHCICTILLS